MSAKTALVGVCELAKRLGVSYERGRKLIAALKLEPVIDGRQPLYSWAQVQRALGMVSGEPEKATQIATAPVKQERPKTIQVHVSMRLTPEEIALFDKYACGNRAEWTKRVVLAKLEELVTQKVNGLDQAELAI